MLSPESQRQAVQTRRVNRERAAAFARELAREIADIAVQASFDREEADK